MFCIKKKWIYKTTDLGGKAMLFGVNILDYERIDTGETVFVSVDENSTEHKASVYTAVVNGKERRFASCELSNCVFGFWVEKSYLDLEI